MNNAPSKMTLELLLLARFKAQNIGPSKMHIMVAGWESKSGKCNTNGFVGMQSTRGYVSMLAMHREMAGGQCKLINDPPTGTVAQDVPSLEPVCFGSGKCKGYECKLHPYPVEGFAVDWGFRKCHHYLWGMQNTRISHQLVLFFLRNYDGNNRPIYRLQMCIMMM